MNVSNVLRDNLVSELQIDVNFLRNQIIKKQDENKDKLYGRKVKIIDHDNGMTDEILYIEIINGGDGIFLGVHKTHGYGKVLRINDDNDIGKVCLVRLGNIVFENVSEIFS